MSREWCDDCESFIDEDGICRCSIYDPYDDINEEDYYEDWEEIKDSWYDNA